MRLGFGQLCVASVKAATRIGSGSKEAPTMTNREPFCGCPTRGTLLCLAVLVGCGSVNAYEEPNDDTEEIESVHPCDRGDPCGAAEQDYENPEYDPYAHACRSDDDCAAGATCGTIGTGAPAPDSLPDPRTYCLRDNSGDCCPPSAPPQER